MWYFLLVNCASGVVRAAAGNVGISFAKSTKNKLLRRTNLHFFPNSYEVLVASSQYMQRDNASKNHQKC